MQRQGNDYFSGNRPDGVDVSQPQGRLSPPAPEILIAVQRVRLSAAQGLCALEPVLTKEAERLKMLGFVEAEIFGNLVQATRNEGLVAADEMAAVDGAITLAMSATSDRSFGQRTQMPRMLPSGPIGKVDDPLVSAINIVDFLKQSFPPRRSMLSPWLPEQGLALLHAPRGVGKTHYAHGVAVAIATGSEFLLSKASQPRRVLLLDGEMPAVVLQERIRAALTVSGATVEDPNFLRLAAADLLPNGLPDLSDPKNHQFYADVVANADCVITDNLSTICPGLKENDADSWTPVQAWALSLRRAGKSGLFVHHDGKSGKQRGTSRKEDVLDTVIALRRPPDYSAEQGARFEVHFEKARGFHGEDAASFEARLAEGRWQFSSIKSGQDTETLKTLHKQGLSLREIADRTGISKSTIQRRLERDD